MSLVLRSQRAYSEENGRRAALPTATATATTLATATANSTATTSMRSCNCCPYGYHIDLDFVRYCETLAHAKPSEEELRRRTRRRSRKSMEFMLGSDNIFEQWDAAARVQAKLHEAAHESETDSTHPTMLTSAAYMRAGRRAYDEHNGEAMALRQRRSSSMPRYGSSSSAAPTRSESPYGTASSTCSSVRAGNGNGHGNGHGTGTDSEPLTPTNLSLGLRFGSAVNNQQRETKAAFLRDALEEVCSDFERTLERTSIKRSNARYNNSDRNNNSLLTSNGYDSGERGEQRTLPYWQQRYFDVADSCVSSQRSPPPPTRQSRLFSRSNTLPLQHSPSVAELQYESYVKATVAANAKSPVPELDVPLPTPPPPPPRRHQLTAQSKHAYTSPVRVADAADASDNNNRMPFGTPNAEAQTLLGIRQQMALSLKRMRDLEEQVKTIPELQHELDALRAEKQCLQRSLLRKEEELLRARDATRLSSLSPSPAVSPKYASPVQFTPQRISPIALESLNARMRTHSSSSERQLKPVLKRDVSTMCAPPVTRDIGVGSAVEWLCTAAELQTRLDNAINEYDAQRLAQLVSVGTQMYVPKRDLCERAVQTQVAIPVQSCHVGVQSTPARRESSVQCKPNVRDVSCTADSVLQLPCARCAAPKKSVASNTVAEEQRRDSASKQALSLKLLGAMTARSNTFSLGDNEPLQLKRKSIGTQCAAVMVHSSASQTSRTVVHTIGIQNVPEVYSAACQAQPELSSRQTDTCNLLRLSVSELTSQELMPAARQQLRHCASNTDAVQVPKRDVSCGDIVKPHISIACADNYCDSCKDAIKNLARDFSKSNSGGGGARSASTDSRIPRPRPQLASPSPVRKPFKRQNTYTIACTATSTTATTASATATPTALTPLTQRKAITTSTLQETPPSPTNFVTPKTVATEPKRSEAKSKPVSLEQLVQLDSSTNLSWTPDASPATTPKSFASMDVSSTTITIEPDITDAADIHVDDICKKSDTPRKSSQSEESQVTVIERALSQDDNEVTVPGSGAEAQTAQRNSSSSSSEQKLLDAQKRQKRTPSKELANALRIINDSLLKKLSAKPFSSSSLKSAKTTIQQEWFKISSTEKANSTDVADYLAYFEGLSVPLLEYCVNMTDANGNTAMHYAVSHGNFDVVSVLLDSKVCNVNQLNNAGYTCVMLVSLAKLKHDAHRIVVERLFQLADVNIRAKKHRQTALMLAVSHGNNDMVTMLLNAGADINIQDEDGSTALMCAAEHGRIDIVKYLLSQPECDSLKQDVDGSTAFKIAWQATHRDIALLLYVHEQMLRSKLPSCAEEDEQVEEDNAQP